MKLVWLEEKPVPMICKGTGHLTCHLTQKNNPPPCIFGGSIMTGHPPIYVGLYIDDLIYFSASE